MPVIFWTDAMAWLLVAVVVGFGWFARHRPHLLAPWRRVAASPVGIGSLVVLAAYVVIGLMDSVHFHPRMESVEPTAEAQYSREVMSLFDLWATPLREREEKTYSAPFATHLYSKETVIRPDGSQSREYPRLVYGGAHLEDPAGDRLGDIVGTGLGGAAEALVVWLGLGALLVLWLARHHGRRFVAQLADVVRGRTEVPWRVALLTLGILLLLGFASARLGVKYHILGTDKVGQDVFYQALKSIRTGLMIGTLTTLIMLPGAILLGIMAGYFRGWVDDLIQYIYTTLNSIPGVLLIAAAILMLQVYLSGHEDEITSAAQRADLRLLFLCLILGVTSWTSLCRLLRGETLKLREVDYVQAAHAFGVGHLMIIWRHLLPNVLHIVLITVVLDFSGLVLAEAVLSYVGIGVDPTMNSWGNMINSARLEMAREPIVWWSLSAAMIFMFTLVLCANLFSDVVRDAFDPRSWK